MKKKRKTTCSNASKQKADEVKTAQPPAKKAKRQHEGLPPSNASTTKKDASPDTTVAAPTLERVASESPKDKTKEKTTKIQKNNTPPPKIPKDSSKMLTSEEKNILRVNVRVKRMFSQVKSDNSIEALCNFAKHKLWGEEYTRARFDSGLFEVHYPSKTNTKKRAATIKLNQEALDKCSAIAPLFMGCKDFWECYKKYNSRAAFIKDHEEEHKGKHSILLFGRFSYGVPTQNHKCHACQGSIMPDTILFWHTQNEELENTFFCVSCVENIVYHLEKQNEETQKKRDDWLAAVIANLKSERKDNKTIEYD
mmetsp:Transcript_3476/g.3829  ORF Transcript_3476/g.3829 Transcript_3476/m.3829 type:complete len:309 (-) Transcript_3476:531-1457(-)